MSSRDFQETSRETVQKKKKKREREREGERQRKENNLKTNKASPAHSTEPMGPIKRFAT